MVVNFVNGVRNSNYYGLIVFVVHLSVAWFYFSLTKSAFEANSERNKKIAEIDAAGGSEEDYPPATFEVPIGTGNALAAVGAAMIIWHCMVYYTKRRNAKN